MCKTVRIQRKSCFFLDFSWKSMHVLCLRELTTIFNRRIDYPISTSTTSDIYDITNNGPIMPDHACYCVSRPCFARSLIFPASLVILTGVAVKNTIWDSRNMHPCHQCDLPSLQHHLFKKSQTENRVITF